MSFWFSRVLMDWVALFYYMLHCGGAQCVVLHYIALGCVIKPIWVVLSSPCYQASCPLVSAFPLR